MGPALRSLQKPDDGHGKEGELWVPIGKQAFDLA